MHDSLTVWEVVIRGGLLARCDVVGYAWVDAGAQGASLKAAKDRCVFGQRSMPSVGQGLDDVRKKRNQMKRRLADLNGGKKEGRGELEEGSRRKSKSREKKRPSFIERTGQWLSRRRVVDVSKTRKTGQPQATCTSGDNLFERTLLVSIASTVHLWIQPVRGKTFCSQLLRLSHALLAPICPPSLYSRPLCDGGVHTHHSS